jgi:hypothetical protein
VTRLAKSWKGEPKAACWHGGSVGSWDLVVSSGVRRAWRSALVALVLIPLVVLAVVLAVKLGHRFAPDNDTAEATLRARDVGSHPVLVGLYSRFGWSHPGPALDYILAIGYRVAGNSSVGLWFAALVLNGASIVAVLVLGYRVGGRALLVLCGVAMALLVHHLGPAFVASPWAPYAAVFPFAAFIVSCWAAACGVRWVVPIVVGLASFCIQAHVGYVPLTVPVVAWTAMVLLVRYRRDGLRPQTRELITAAAVGTVLWLPPVIQQLTATHGNLSTILSYFREPPEPVQSLGHGWLIVTQVFGTTADWLRLRSVDLGLLAVPKSSIREVPVLLVLFGAAGALTMRRGTSETRAVLGVLVVSFAAAIVAVWRTNGLVVEYRLGWLPTLAVLTLAATVWFLWADLRTRIASRRLNVTRAGALFMAVAAITVLTAANVADAESTSMRRAVGPAWNVAPDLLQRARRFLPTVPGQVIVRAKSARWYLPATVLWLEEHGYDARVPDEHASKSPTWTIYDDTELVFGVHRICDQTHVAAELDIENGTGNPGPEYRPVAQASYSPPSYLSGHWTSPRITVRLFERVSRTSDVSIACRGH